MDEGTPLALWQKHWLTPPEVTEVVPGTNPVSVRRWALEGKLPGSIQLPSGRWQIPWSAVVGILGFDPRVESGPVSPSSPVSPSGVCGE